MPLLGTGAERSQAWENQRLFGKPANGRQNGLKSALPPTTAQHQRLNPGMGRGIRVPVFRFSPTLLLSVDLHGEVAWNRIRPLWLLISHLACPE
jgi:hypothetical protein